MEASKKVLAAIELLKHSDLSMKEIGKQVGLSQSYITRINSGERVIEGIQYPIRGRSLDMRNRILALLEEGYDYEAILAATKYESSYVTAVLRSKGIYVSKRGK